jgi:hypothetical protein
VIAAIVLGVLFFLALLLAAFLWWRKKRRGSGLTFRRSLMVNGLSNRGPGTGGTGRPPSTSSSMLHLQPYQPPDGLVESYHNSEKLPPPYTVGGAPYASGFPSDAKSDSSSISQTELEFESESGEESSATSRSSVMTVPRTGQTGPVLPFGYGYGYGYGFGGGGEGGGGVGGGAGGGGVMPVLMPSPSSPNIPMIITTAPSTDGSSTIRSPTSTRSSVTSASRSLSHSNYPQTIREEEARMPPPPPQPPARTSIVFKTLPYSTPSNSNSNTNAFSVRNPSR